MFGYVNRETYIAVSITLRNTSLIEISGEAKQSVFTNGYLSIQVDCSRKENWLLSVQIAFVLVARVIKIVY